MNLILLQESEREKDNWFILQGRKKEHILNVLKAKMGDSFQAGILNQKFGEIFIQKITKDSLEVEFQANQYTPSFTPSIQLFSAFQRPQTTKKILQLASCMGVKEIHFFPFDKSERSYQTSSLWKEDEWKDECILGLEQGKRILLPALHLNFDYKENIDFSFPEHTFLLDLEGESFPSYLPLGKNANFAFILGPESGLTPRDRNFFLTKGAKPLRLSSNILRSEFALAFALSQLELVIN